ncbi:MAG: hypothetical protein F4Z14_11835 [Gammaproteobacteria bacterium]|nr:hypothetical protein [Gammaproteobacteria bacterium]
MKAVFGKTQRIVARTRNENIKMYRLGVPFLILGKPVLYVRMMADETGTVISGRFTFSILSRAIFWLGHLGVIAMFGIGIFRIVSAQSRDEPFVWYLYGSLALLVSGMIGFLIYSWYSWTWQNRRADMTMLTERLKFILTSKAPDSKNKTQ